LLAMLNLALLAGVFIVFLQSRVQSDLESFLMAGARDRISALATQVASDLEAADNSEWNDLFQRYSEANGIQVLLYRNTREQLAGPTLALPSPVEARMPPRPGPRNGRGGPPESGFDRPPRARGEFDDGPRGQRGGPDGPGGRGGPGDGGGRPFLVVTDGTPKYWVGMRMPVVHRENGEELFSVLVLVSNSFFLNSFFFEARSWLGLGAVAALISVVCWLPLVRNITRSVSDMMRATGRIADGRFDVQVNAGRHDEIGRLGASIKQMAGRLESYTEGRTRFLGSVAHELRSPIARMQLATEILERNADKDSKKYIDYLRDDIQTMSRLTDELLQVARAETAPGPVKVQPVNVEGVIEAVLRRESSEGAEIRVHVTSDLAVQANAEYLSRAVGNVVRNAVRYAAQHGPITISAQRDRNEVAIVITDSGPGVPDGDLDRIFMPFYRLDDARDRRTGGTGLGLAIVRTCVEACGGRVTASNRKPSGLEIAIRLAAA